jgi:hypothetical protein
MTWSPCPDALYGQHGDPNTNGNCPYCGAKIAGRRRSQPGRGRRSITREQEDYLDSRTRERDAWGQLRVPLAQDPLQIDAWESDDQYYE